ncbi:MAG: VOC family protein [Pseudomonadota bacterium]
MKGVGLATLLVRDYDEAIAFFREVLRFRVTEDVPSESTLQPGAMKRWVVIEAPKGGARLLLARAADERQTARIGDQTGGRVTFFLYSDDFEGDLARLKTAGAAFPRGGIKDAPYGRFIVFEDVAGNLWDLIDAPN